MTSERNSSTGTGTDRCSDSPGAGTGAAAPNAGGSAMSVTGTLATLRPDSCETGTFTEFRECEAPALVRGLETSLIRLEHGVTVPGASVEKAWVDSSAENGEKTVKVRINIPPSQDNVTREFAKRAVEKQLYPSLSLKHTSKTVWNPETAEYDIEKTPTEVSLVRTGQRKEAKIESFMSQLEETTAAGAGGGGAPSEPTRAESASAPTGAPTGSTPVAENTTTEAAVAASGTISGIEDSELKSIVGSLQSANPKDVENFARFAQRYSDAQRERDEYKKQVQSLESEKTEGLVKLLQQAHDQIYSNVAKEDAEAKQPGHLKRVRDELTCGDYTSKGRCASEALESSLQLVAAASSRISDLESSLAAAQKKETSLETQRQQQTTDRRTEMNKPHIERVQEALGGASKTPFGSANAAGKQPADDGLARSPFYSENYGGNSSVFDRILELGKNSGHAAKRPRHAGSGIGGPSSL